MTPPQLTIDTVRFGRHISQRIFARNLRNYCNIPTNEKDLKQCNLTQYYPVDEFAKELKSCEVHEPLHTWRDKDGNYCASNSEYGSIDGEHNPGIKKWLAMYPLTHEVELYYNADPQSENSRELYSLYMHRTWTRIIRIPPRVTRTLKAKKNFPNQT